MNERTVITSALKNIFESIENLRCTFPHKKFTIDGRLVGDIGEVLASLDYDITLDSIQHADHDGETSNGRKVQIKATFKDSLTFRTEPDYYLGLKLRENGTYEEIYNGPGFFISEEYKHRKGFGQKLLLFPIQRLKELSMDIDDSDRIQKR